jgi:hypothetical protein
MHLQTVQTLADRLSNRAGVLRAARYRLTEATKVYEQARTDVEKADADFNIVRAELEDELSK